MVAGKNAKKEHPVNYRWPEARRAEVAAQRAHDGRLGDEPLQVEHGSCRQKEQVSNTALVYVDSLIDYA
jgi:hypothetical protein